MNNSIMLKRFSKRNVVQKEKASNKLDKILLRPHNFIFLTIEHKNSHKHENTLYCTHSHQYMED